MCSTASGSAIESQNLAKTGGELADMDRALRTILIQKYIIHPSN